MSRVGIGMLLRMVGRGFDVVWDVGMQDVLSLLSCRLMGLKVAIAWEMKAFR